MKWSNRVPTAIVAVVAAVCGWGWFQSTKDYRDDASEDFSSCLRDQDSMTLKFNYGQGDDVAVSRTPRGDGDVTVWLSVKGGPGDNTMIGLIGEAVFTAPKGKVYYPDGRELVCEEAGAAS